MSRHITKPTICIYAKTKIVAAQLISNFTDRTIPLLVLFKVLTFLVSSVTVQFVSDLVGNNN